MTNSTEVTKVKKAPGPIRTGALVPTLIFFVISYAYFHFFFDNHLRRGVEWTAGYVHGAEVDVASITTSFFGGSFRMQGLEITDKEVPSRNLFSVGDIRFGFSWDALLRLKFVVEEAAVENIQALAPRRSPGWVKPPEPPSGKPSAVEQIENNALAQAESQFSGQVLGDIAKVLGGTDEKEVLKNIQGQLKAEQFIDGLKVTLKEKETFWRNKIETLPRKEEFEALNKRAKELKFNTKDPSQFAKDLKELKKIVKEADTKINSVKDAGDGFKNDTDKLKDELSQVDDLIKKDIQDIEDRLKIGKINFADFSKD
ncbi:MAG: TIGR03545 family protein, partial [Bdellovibrionota bacterium]